MAQLKSTNITGNLSVTGNVLASKIIKFGGTADDILMGDGSITSKQGLIDSLEAAMEGNSWRPIKYGTTTVSDTSTTLEFIAGSNIGLTFNTNGQLTIANNYSYSLPLAANGTRGGIQVGYTASGANLPVQLSSEKAYVALTKTAVESVVTIPTVYDGTLTLKASDGATATEKTFTANDADNVTFEVKHAIPTGAKADSYGPSDGGEQAAKGTMNITVPQITTDKFGHVTSVSNKTFKVTDTNTDTQVTQTITTSSNTSKRPLLLGYSYSDANPVSFSTVTNTAYASHNIYVAPKEGYLYANKFLGTSTNVSWYQGRDSAAFRDLGSAGYHAALSLKTTNGSWEFGNYNAAGYHDIPLLTYITDANYNSKNNSTTYQIKFPLKSGTLALTSDLKNGTVTSVDVTSTSLTVTGSPVTGTGTITIEHPTTTATTADVYKIGKDTQGHVVIGDKITSADLGLSTVYKYKGTKTWAELLALTKAEAGDVYSITDKDPDGNTNADWACYAAVTAACTTANYTSYWQSLGGKVDLSAYVTGSGTANYIPKFTAAGAIGNSVITQSDKNDITVAGKLIVQSNGSASANSYNEGIRVLPASNGWSELFFSNTQATSSTHANGWILGKRGAAGATSGAAGDFTIECNGSGGTGLTLYADNTKRPRWNNNELAYKSDFGTGGSMDLSAYATLAGDQTFSGKNIFTATNNYNTLDTQKFLVGNNISAFCIGGDGLQCFSGTNSTTAKTMYINYYGGNVEIGKTGGTQIINLYGTVKENGTALSDKYLGKTAKAADSDKLDGQDSSYYMKASDISNHISGQDQPNLAYFATASKVAYIANTSADGVGNIKAVSYGIYTDVANNKTATWQYNSSTDCVELVW